MCLRAATLAALMTGACSAPGDTSAPTVAAQPDAAAPSAVDAAATAAGATVDLSSELEALRKTHGLPALAGAVYRDGALVGAGAAGVRKLGDPTAVTSSDVWHLGSAEKFLVEDEFVKRARLALHVTTRHVIKIGLALIGVSAPEKM